MNVGESVQQRLLEFADLQSQAHTLFCQVYDEVRSKSDKVLSVQLMRDQDFTRIRDRAEGDLHMFFELVDSKIFHLRAYLHQMLARRRAEQASENGSFSRIMLTAYRKPSVQQHGGSHSLRQDLYPWDAASIAEEIIIQNRDIFYDAQQVREDQKICKA